MSVDSRTPEMAEVIKKAIASALSSLHVGMPGVIVSYDPATQTADVQPLVQSRNSSDDVPVTLPVLRAVPVLFPRAGGFRLTFPVAKGDTVHLEFCERAIDSWMGSGSQQPVDPVSTRRHHLSDAVACLGLYDSQHALGTTPPANALSLGADGGPELQIDGTNVNVNATGAGAKVGITVGAGGMINLNVGVGGTINLGGSGKTIAMLGDTAGPWPLVCKSIIVKGA